MQESPGLKEAKPFFGLSLYSVGVRALAWLSWGRDSAPDNRGAFTKARRQGQKLSFRSGVPSTGKG